MNVVTESMLWIIVLVTQLFVSILKHAAEAIFSSQTSTRLIVKISIYIMHIYLYITYFQNTTSVVMNQTYMSKKPYAYAQNSSHVYDSLNDVQHDAWD